MLVVNKKKGLFKKGDRNALKQVQVDLKRAITEEKAAYRDRIEGLFTDNNMKRVWDGIRLMSGYTSKSRSRLPVTTVEYADELNQFYNRFDNHDFSAEHNGLQDLLTHSACDLVVTEGEVLRQFSRLNPSKAAGPDNLSSRVLKNCAIELANIFTVIFNMSFRTGIVPSLWKQSCLIPVPKKSNISCMNDLRPVVLTAVPMKVCERIFLNYLKPLVDPILDPLQFAYRSDRSCEDAILVLLDLLYSHLELNRNSARIIFFDFSSAFNTIQPHILITKLMGMDIPHGLIQWIMWITSQTEPSLSN